MFQKNLFYNFFFQKKNPNKISVTEIQQQQQQLQRILQLLTQLEQMGDSIVFDPNICQQPKTIFIIWYENKLDKISQELDEIIEGLQFFFIWFFFRVMEMCLPQVDPNKARFFLLYSRYWHFSEYQHLYSKKKIEECKRYFFERD